MKREDEMVAVEVMRGDSVQQAVGDLAYRNFLYRDLSYRERLEDLHQWQAFLGLLEREDMYKPETWHWHFQFFYTPERAKYLLATYLYHKQRLLREWKVLELERVILRHQYQPCEAIFHRTPQKSYMTQFQHRAHAVVRSGCAVFSPTSVYWCRDEDAVRVAYNRLDRGVMRTMAEALKDADLARESGLKAADLNNLGRGVWSVAKGFQANKLTREEMALRHSTDYREDLVHVFLDPGRRYFTAIEKATGKLRERLRNADTVGIGLVTLFHSDKADGFWKLVANNSKLEKGTPEHTLVDFLLTESPSKMRHSSDYAKGIARCWNAWIDGSRLSVVRPRGDDKIERPIFIRKTPFDGAVFWVIDPETLEFVSRPFRKGSDEKYGG